MAVPLEKFVQQLEDSGIIAGDTLKDFLPPQNKPKDAEELALELVRKKKLTKFQAEEVSRGKGKSLVLGNYVLMEKIGAGGMGQVFKARHKVMNRAVAVKVLPTAMTRDKAAIARFHREVQVAAKLRHINIVAADDADQANGVHFLVMELVEGSDLSALVKKNGPFPVDKAVNYILQAAKGLEFAHAEGVVHRDIKPANLLLDKKGTVKILDMGLARIRGDGAQAELTSTGAVMGTVDYMAPEQALNTKTADARADVYSLGCSLFYLLNGKSTYDGDTLMSKLLAHRDQPIPKLRDLLPFVPESLELVFQKMVAKKAEDRYQSMTEVIAGLESCCCGPSNPLTFPSSGTSQSTLDHDKSVSSRTATLLLPTGVGDGSRVHRRRWILAGFAAFLILFLSGIWVVVRNNKGEVVATVKVPEDGSVTVGPSSKVDSDSSKQSAAFKNDSMIIFAEVGQELPKWNLPEGSPAPAHEPFSAGDAVTLQNNWAEYLGTPIEIINSIGMKFRLIPPGDFQIGVTDEEVARVCKELNRETSSEAKLARSYPSPRNTRLTRALYFGMTEVTFSQFKQFIDDTRYVTSAESSPEGGMYIHMENLSAIYQRDPRYNWRTPHDRNADPNEPVSQVSVRDMKRFCRWLVEKEGVDYRLPTESEWEFAARAGEQSQGLHTVNPQQLFNFAWLTGTPRRNLPTDTALPVALLEPNAFGLFDCIGNVDEACKVDQPRRRNDEISFDYSNRGGGYVGWAEFATTATCMPNHSQAEAERVGSAQGFRIICEIKLNAAGKAAEVPKINAIRKEGPPVSSSEGKPAPKRALLAFEKPGFDQWVKDVHALSAEQQVEAVSKKLMELNPGFDGMVTGFYRNETPKIENGVVTSFGCDTDTVTDISPTRALVGLQTLNCCGRELGMGKLIDLSPLKGMPLSQLNIHYTQVADLSPLNGIPLKRFDCDGTKVTNLFPLKGMPLSDLFCGHSNVSDLTPLIGMNLTSLACDWSQVADLSPLKGMPLEGLQCQNTKVANLTPLKDMPLAFLDIGGTQVADLTPLKNMNLTTLSVFSTQVTDFSSLKELPLKLLYLDFKPERDKELLRSIKTLETINGKPAAEFWKEVEEHQKGKKLGFQMPGFDQWVKDVQALPAEKQLEAVSKKLMELNPGFDGKVKSGFAYRNVVSLGIFTDDVTDISPVRALTHLSLLGCQGSELGKGKLSDLSPITGMGISTLFCPYSPLITDLTPLKGMQLKDFTIGGSKVTELSPLKGMPLTKLCIGEMHVSDLSPLNGMALEILRINNTEVSDLSPLLGMPLKELDCSSTRVADLSALAGMPLNEIGFNLTLVIDLSPLKGLRLTKVSCWGTPVADLSPLQGMKLTSLICGGTKVTDLSPLRGMPLSELDCVGNQFYDLSPLIGMPLTKLSVPLTLVSDLSPLEEMNLTEISFTPKNITKGLDVIRQMKTLKTIGPNPEDRFSAEEFWKKYDAGEFGKPQ